MTTLSVYMDDGRVFEYEVADAMKAREFAHRIVTGGPRINVGEFNEWYPPHRVLKVKWKHDGSSNYPNTVRAT